MGSGVITEALAGRHGFELRLAAFLSACGVLRHRDMYQKLFTTMIGFLNMGFGPEDAVQRNPLKEYEKQFGDASTFTYGALRTMMIDYVPD